MKLEDLKQLPIIPQKEKSKLVVGHIKESAQVIPAIDATLYKYHNGELEAPMFWRQHSHDRYKLRQSLVYVFGIVEREQHVGEKTNFLAFAFGREPYSDHADTISLIDLKEIEDYQTEKPNPEKD